MALLCAAQHAWAQGNFTWDGGGTDNNWTTAANWNPDGAPGSPQNNLNFAGSTRLTPNNNFGNYSAGYRIFFNSGASSFTQGGNPIKFFDFSGNRAIIQNDSANTQTINLRVGAGNSTGGLDFYANAGDMIYNGGAIDNGTVFMDGGSQIRFPAGNGHTITFNKGIVDGSAAGSVAIQANTIVIYNAACTYSGGTFLDAGQLQISTNGSVAGTISIGPVTSSSADAAVYAQPAAGGLTITNAITVRSGGSGPLTLGGLNTSSENVFSGSITLQKSVSLSAATGGSTRFSGVISETTAGSGVTIGRAGNTGTVVYDNAMTYTGPTTVSFGTLKLNAANRIPDSSALSVASGATFDMNNSSETVGSISGAGNISVGTGQLIAGQDNSATTFSGVMSGTSSGSFVKKGTGTLTLSGANTYSGQTFAVGGTLSFNAAQDSGFTGTINVGETSGTDAATVAIGTSGVTISNPLNVRSGSSGTKTVSSSATSGSATFSGNTTLGTDLTTSSASGGTLTLSGSTLDLKNQTLTVTGSGSTLISGVLQQSTGSSQLTKSGSGT
ncbi:MAG: hypothetical protein DME25_09275, partial [Verrucomicrobia bacterium]